MKPSAVRPGASRRPAKKDTLESPSPRVLVIGIDGFSYTLARRFTSEGVMPNLASYLSQGTLRQMDVTLPEVSNVSWTTFSTGVNPARHGIFGFLDINPSTGRLFYPSSADNRATPLWDLLGQAGKSSIVVNVPGTYPARPLHGVLISGFVSIDLARATYPRILVPRLEQLGYRLDVDANLAHQGRMIDFLADCHESLRRRSQAFDLLWSYQPWDLFIATITETDRIHHFLWDAVADDTHPWNEAVRAFYREIDRVVGDLYERLRPGDCCFIVSDHGFTGIEQETFLNRWLEEAGYLSFLEGPRSVERIHPKSRAFALDPSRIYIRTRERFPEGAVPSGREYERVRDEIVAGLERLTYGDEPGGRSVVHRVYRKEALYSGPFLDSAPDLVVVAKDGFDLKGRFDASSIFGRSLFKGHHTHDDATFFATGRSLTEQRPHIADVAPTILGCLGLPVPRDIDGRSLLASQPTRVVSS